MLKGIGATRAAACDGKVQFQTGAIARKAASRQEARHAYKCKFCGGWHVGSLQWYAEGPIAKNGKPKPKPPRYRETALDETLD